MITALNDKEVPCFKKTVFYFFRGRPFAFCEEERGMNDPFLHKNFFYRKPLETDKGVRFFPALYVMRDIFFSAGYIFARYFLPRYFFPRNPPL